MDIMFAYMTYMVISLSKVREEIQIVAALVVIGYTLWKWIRDYKNNNSPKQ